MRENKVIITVIAVILCLGIVAVMGSILLNSEPNNVVYSQVSSNMPENEEEEQLIRVSIQALTVLDVFERVIGSNFENNENYAGAWFDCISNRVLNIGYIDCYDEFKEALSSYIVSDEESSSILRNHYVRFVRKEFSYNYLRTIQNVIGDATQDDFYLFSIVQVGVRTSANNVSVYHKEETNIEELVEYLYSAMPNFNRNSVTFTLTDEMPSIAIWRG